MARSQKPQMEKLPAQGIQALKSLSVQFISFVVEEGLKGQPLDKIIAAFIRHQAKIIGGVLGSVGIAGGTWAAISLWTSSLGLWGSLSYSLGIITMPIWVPVAGGVAGLTAAGGAIYGVISLARNRQETRKLQSIIGFSKLLIGKDELGEEDERQLHKILSEQKVDEKKIERLLRTTAAESRKLASSLSEEQGMEVARYLFPLVYADKGVISSTDRSRFGRICSDLNLPEGTATQISAEYRQRLDVQWDYLESIILRLNHFANMLELDRPEMELLREQLAQLMNFDPRKASTRQREQLLRKLSGRERDTVIDIDEGQIIDEAALMGAYALAQTVAPEPESQELLEAAFDAILDANTHLPEKYKEELKDSRQKIGRLYDVTRTQILAAEKKTAGN